MFTTYPSYDRFRTLKLSDPMQHGEDVFALQTALIYDGYHVGDAGADGWFGSDTNQSVRHFQEAHGLVVDGLAGGKTQEALAIRSITSASGQYGLPRGLLYGQISHESSFRLGNYSVFYVGTSSWDSGPAQENSNVFLVKHAFTVPAAISDCAARCRKYADKFVGLPQARRWGLAAAAWNKPATACWIAKHDGATGVLSSDLPARAPSQTEIDRLEEYVVSVTAYLVV